MINKIELYKLKLPLVKPYNLSFGSVENFNTILSKIHFSDGTISYGETTLLKGYSPETLADSWELNKELADRIVNQEIENALQILEGYLEFPFAVSALANALYFKDINIDDLSFNIVGIISEKKINQIKDKLDIILEKGYKVVKVKIGENVKSDVKRINYIAQNYDIDIRVDANQGYTYKEINYFIDNVLDDNLQLIEQPLDKKEWEIMKKLHQRVDVPLMLDEAIWTKHDIDKAQNCSDIIKLKLFKCGSVKKMIELINYAHSLGLKVLIGNGVQTEIACIYEGYIQNNNKLDYIGEMNGFLKLQESLGDNILEFNNGRAILNSDIKLKNLKRYIIERIEIVY